MTATRFIEGVGTMPIYEYKCAEGHRFEVTQTFSDLPITTCQACAEPVTKVISAPAIMFKGSGWYITDYSDKMKPPGQSESAGKPTNGQGEQKSGEPASKEATTSSATPASAPSSPAQAGTASTAGGGTSS